MMSICASPRLTNSLMMCPVERNCLVLQHGLLTNAMLLQADVGIIIGRNATLRAFADAAGVSIKPLLMAASETAIAPEGTLYQAESWWEVQAFLFGENSSSTPSWSFPMRSVYSTDTKLYREIDGA